MCFKKHLRRYKKQRRRYRFSSAARYILSGKDGVSQINAIFFRSRFSAARRALRYKSFHLAFKANQ